MNMGICFLYFLYFQQSWIPIVVYRPLHGGSLGRRKRWTFLLRTPKTTEIFYTRVKLGGETRAWGLDYGSMQSKIAQRTYRGAL